jgi:site-specific DNA-methyltransferase (adenine-specific)
MRPYFDEGGITIYHGDCRELLPTLPTAAAVLADLPYGFDAYATDRRVPLGPIMAAAPVVALFGYPELVVEWAVELGRVATEWITWWPRNAALKAGGRHKLLARQTEVIAVFGDEALLYPNAVTEPRSANRPAVNGDTAESRRAGDVWTDTSPGLGFNYGDRLHPNQKPLSLMLKLVSFCSAPGDLVIDPTMGSGTTLLAAKELGRRAIGIELTERDCETAAKRLAQGCLFQGVMA